MPSSFPPNGSADSSPVTNPQRQAVPVNYEYSVNLPELLAQLNLSILISTYQAGRVASLGVHQGELRVGFAHFDQAMGLTRTATGIAVGAKKEIWFLPASKDIAPQIKPEGERDMAFLARSCHQTGPIMGHDLAFSQGRLWVVNTLFDCLATVEGNWSFAPQWKPPFIAEIAPGDRCHLNGLALGEDGFPAYVTALGETNEENGWRENKATGGCLLEVKSGDVVLRGLSMPHSPRLYQGLLSFLDSGRGTLHLCDRLKGESEVIAELPGFTRGLDCWEGHAFVGLSQIRETAVFGGLPLDDRRQNLRCGLAIVNLAARQVVGTFWFNSGVEEVFAVSVLPGYRNPALIGPNTELDDAQSVWLVPSMA
ncbi:MAG: TIGR03032 family protein [Synechocystis sp.]